MDFKKALELANKALDFADDALPYVKMIPVVGSYVAIAEKVVNAVGAATEIAKSVKQSVDDGTIIATSQDQGELKALIARLDKKADELNEYIVNS